MNAETSTTFVDLHKVTLRVQTRGNAGPVVVLIHEMGGAIESWKRVTPRLAASRRVVCFDMRGAGMSEKITRDVSIDDLAEDLQLLLDKLGIEEPVAVVGCAVGGAIALAFAAAYPNRTAAVVVLDPAIDATPKAKSSLLARAAALPTEGMRSIEAESLMGGYPPILRAREPGHFDEFRARWLGNDPGSLAFLFRMLANTDLWSRLPGIRCPVLGLAGIHDELRPPAYVRSVLAKVPDGRVQEIDAGHHMPDQAPDTVGARIAGFLDEVQPAGVPEPDSRAP